MVNKDDYVLIETHIIVVRIWGCCRNWTEVELGCLLVY